MDEVTVVVGILLVCALLALALLVRRRDINSTKPNTALPQVVADLVPTATIKSFIQSTPWTPQVDRAVLRCRTKTCNATAYVASLGPVPTNTWHLETQKDLRTGWALEYPVATVVEIPANARFQYILDTGLVPLVEEDGSVLNMGPLWWDPEASPEGRNLTGNYVHSFVIHNTSGRTIFFGRTAGESAADYWALLPGTWTLMWPENPYFGQTGPTIWNASPLNGEFMSNALAASMAETMMWSYLRPQAPNP